MESKQIFLRNQIKKEELPLEEPKEPINVDTHDEDNNEVIDEVKDVTPPQLLMKKITNKITNRSINNKK